MFMFCKVYILLFSSLLNMITASVDRCVASPEAVVQRCSVKKVFLEISQNSQKHLCQSLFFVPVPCLRPAALLKKRLLQRCFPVNFAKFLRTTSFIEHL